MINKYNVCGIDIPPPPPPEPLINYIVLHNGIIYSIDDPQAYIDNANSGSTIEFMTEGYQVTVSKADIREVYLNIPLTNFGQTNFCRNLFTRYTNCVLFDVKFEGTPTTDIAGNDTFAYMFAHCLADFDIKDFTIPQNIAQVGFGFCQGMFLGCTGFASIPTTFSFPQGIKIAGDNFLNTVFGDCWAITVAPANLKIPNLIQAGDGCLKGAFSYCQGLEEVQFEMFTDSALTSVGSNFLQRMFYRCPKLKLLGKNFALPENLTTLSTVNFCNEMFFRCTSLIQGTGVPTDTKLYFQAAASFAFEDTTIKPMSPSAGQTIYIQNEEPVFSDKIILDDGRVLLIDDRAAFVMGGTTWNNITFMSGGVAETVIKASIKQVTLDIPLELFGRPNYCQSLFMNYTNCEIFDIKFIGTPGSNIAADNTFTSMFAYCRADFSIGDFTLPQNITQVGYNFCANMFGWCSGLSEIPLSFELPQNIVTAGEYFLSGMFSGCTSLTILPDNLNIPDLETVSNSCLSSFASDCTNLEEVHFEMFGQNLKEIGAEAFFYMFGNCPNLRRLGAGFKLPSMVDSFGSDYALMMFEECTSLVQGTGAASDTVLEFITDAFDCFSGTSITPTSPTEGDVVYIAN